MRRLILVLNTIGKNTIRIVSYLFIGIIVIVTLLYTQLDIQLKFNAKELKESIWNKGIKMALQVKEVVK